MTSDPIQMAIDQLGAPDYQRDVYRWARDKLDVYIYSLQVQIADLLRENKRVAVPSCHDSGKSFISAVLGCHHIDTHPVGQARLITTAPSGAQVRGVLWGEINGLHEKAKDRGNPLPGRVNQTEWWIGTWQAGIGRKPNDYKPEQFAGFHARYPFVILDEADGLPAEMWAGIEALMTNRLARLLAIGNPLDPQSAFAKAQQNTDEYIVLRIPYNLTPNFTGERVPELLRDVLLDPEWVEARRKEWGGDAARRDPTFQPDHPFWYGRVLAEYPPEGMHTIIRVSDLEVCRMLEALPPTSGVRQMGLDIAGSESGDKTIARERVGPFILRKWELQSSDDDDVAEFAIECAKTMQASTVVLDATGMGFGFTGRLRAALKNVAIIPLNYQAGADGKNADGSRKYKNKRAELWWNGRELSQARGWNLTYAQDVENLEFELAAARYRPDVLAKKNIVQVEDKDDIRRRIGRSPDDADATLLAAYIPPGGGIATISSAGATVLPQGAAVAAPRR